MPQKQHSHSKERAVIVFDLDETIGYFTEFSIFWYIVQNYYSLYPCQNKQNISDGSNRNGNLHKQICFNNALELYPELFRPLMIDIFNSLVRKQNSYYFDMMVYTNNNGDKEWVQMIVNYLEFKIKDMLKVNKRLFKKIIYAFKINGKRVEPSRTTHDKTYNDFLKTTAIPKETQICFVDDTYYPDMDTENVFYVNIDPYVYHLPAKTYVQRFIKSPLYKNHFSYIDPNNMIQFLNTQFNSVTPKLTHMTKEKYQVNTVVSKTIWKFLNEFLLDFCNVK
jgi:hypothetical protein